MQKIMTDAGICVTVAVWLTNGATLLVLFLHREKLQEKKPGKTVVVLFG
jgi:hypothetical protein